MDSGMSYCRARGVLHPPLAIAQRTAPRYEQLGTLNPNLRMKPSDSLDQVTLSSWPAQHRGRGDHATI